ncbi:hypothetical protein [Streptomyces venezuelae]|uniref:hypothetical protein n=1 Tax=Streptomyces venezuelae TaxID=54571 RepID=UPI0036500B52
MARMRIKRTTWPRPALVLTDTPRPDCPDCEGAGGAEYDYGDLETGEYAGTNWDPCHCCNEQRRWIVLPLPRRRWRRRRSPDPWAANGYSDEPPF